MAKAHDELTGILTKDHDEVKGIFKKLEKAKSASNREDLVQELFMEIEPHMAGEEEALYPALKKTEKGKETAMESLEEHHVAKMVLQELMEMSGDDEGFKAKATVLQELVSHHIEEEEGKVWSLFAKVVKSDEANKVLEGFQQAKSSRKEALEEEMAPA